MIKKVIVWILVIAFTFAAFMTLTTEKIDQGEVGVVWTIRNGAKDELLGTGRHFVSPFAKVTKYPVSQRQLVLSNNPNDYKTDEHPDWSIDAPANGGIVKLNMTINYNFIQDRILELYAKFNGMDGADVVETMVQNSIVAYIKEVTPQFTVMDIYSDKRAEVSEEITKYLNSKLNDEYGINISSALIIDVQLDDTLMEKVKAKEQAKQDAEKAELDKQTAIAQGEANMAEAEANKKVTITNAEAEAESNRIISESITDELIKMKEAEARLEHGWVEVQGADTVVTK